MSAFTRVEVEEVWQDGYDSLYRIYGDDYIDADWPDSFEIPTPLWNAYKAAREVMQKYKGEILAVQKSLKPQGKRTG